MDVISQYNCRVIPEDEVGASFSANEDQSDETEIQKTPTMFSGELVHDTQSVFHCPIFRTTLAKLR
jgi:hypothetical protein